MNEYEEHTIALAGVLAAGLRNMIDGDRLTEAAIPDDWLWLTSKLNELEDTLVDVAQHDDI